MELNSFVVIYGKDYKLPNLSFNSLLAQMLQKKHQLPQEAHRYGGVCQALWRFFAQLLPGLTRAWSEWGNTQHLTYSMGKPGSKQDQQVSYWNTVQWCKWTSYLVFALQILRSHYGRSSGEKNPPPSSRTVTTTYYPFSYPVRMKQMNFVPDKVYLLEPSTCSVSNCHVIPSAYETPWIFIQLTLGENTFSGWKDSF